MLWAKPLHQRTNMARRTFQWSQVLRMVGKPSSTGWYPSKRALSTASPLRRRRNAGRPGAYSEPMSDDEKPEVLPSALTLASGFSLAVRPGAVESLELKAPDGRVCVRIHLREGGPDVEIEAANLSVAAKGALQLTAKDVSIAASGDFNLHAGGAMTLAAEGAVVLRGHDHHLEATHGDIHLDANDDVRVDGERIRLNAPDAPPLRR